MCWHGRDCKRLGFVGNGGRTTRSVLQSEQEKCSSDYSSEEARGHRHGLRDCGNVTRVNADSSNRVRITPICVFGSRTRFLSRPPLVVARSRSFQIRQFAHNRCRLDDRDVPYGTRCHIESATRNGGLERCLRHKIDSTFGRSSRGQDADPSLQAGDTWLRQ